MISYKKPSTFARENWCADLGGWDIIRWGILVDFNIVVKYNFLILFNFMLFAEQFLIG